MLKLDSAIKETLAVLSAGAAIGLIAWLAQSPDFAKALSPPEKASAEELTAMLQPAADDPGPAATDQTNEVPTAKMISFLDVMTQFFGESNVTFVDGRDQGTYESGHIPGAIHIDAEALDDKPDTGAEILAKVPKKQVLVVYCSGGGCTLSKKLAENLIGRGYSKVVIFEGGWNEWVEQGQLKEEGPMATGGTP